VFVEFEKKRERERERERAKKDNTINRFEVG